MTEINFYLRDGEYGWLSNFARYLQIVGDQVYPTNEHFYQSMRATDPAVRSWIMEAPSPYLAMKAGRALRDGKEFNSHDWEESRVSIMLAGLRAKFSQHEDLKQRLLATGDAVLHEDSPTDMFWGKKGRDMLGKLLMQVREELKSGHLHTGKDIPISW